MQLKSVALGAKVCREQSIKPEIYYISVFQRICWVPGESAELRRGDGKTDAAIPTHPADIGSLPFEEESWCSHLRQWHQSAGTAWLLKRTHSKLRFGDCARHLEQG